MKPKKKNKKRAPRGSTMRNVRAGNKRLGAIDHILKVIFMQLHMIGDRIDTLERKGKK